jgi:hypothetical protein
MTSQKTEGKSLEDSVREAEGIPEPVRERSLLILEQVSHDR